MCIFKTNFYMADSNFQLKNFRMGNCTIPQKSIDMVHKNLKNEHKSFLFLVSPKPGPRPWHRCRTFHRAKTSDIKQFLPKTQNWTTAHSTCMFSFKVEIFGSIRKLKDKKKQLDSHISLLWDKMAKTMLSDLLKRICNEWQLRKD